jgi:UDPglucose 6-dehydrogenase
MASVAQEFKMNIGIIGCDIVGLGFALLCEQNGHDILISDQDENFIYNLNQKICLTNEPLIQSLLLDSQRLSGTTDNIEIIKNSDIIFTFVETPPSVEDTYDTTKVFDVITNYFAASSLDILLYDKKFVVCSTTNPGDVEQIQKRLGMYNIRVAYNPPNVSYGDIINGFKKSEVVIIGTEYDNLNNDLSVIYNQIKESSVHIYSMSIKAAEVAKIGINGFLATKITYANMIGELMNRMGIEKEINLVLNAIGGDSRIGTKYLNYGLGFGGPSIPKSNRALIKYSKDLNLNISLPSSVKNDNDQHIEFLKNQYTQFNPDKSIPFIFDNLGFKKGVQTFDESQQMKLCIGLLTEGYTVYTYATSDSIKKLSELSGSYENRLKFLKQGTNPQGYKINLQ